MTTGGLQPLPPSPRMVWSFVVLFSLFYIQIIPVSAAPPDLASELTAGAITTTGATVTWTKTPGYLPNSAGTFESYKVAITPLAAGMNLSPNPISGDSANPETVITGLTPGTQYTVTVQTQNGTIFGNPKTVTFYALPAAVTAQISTASITNTGATLTWGAVTTGTFKEYVITISPTAGGATVTSPTVAKGATTTTTLTSLTAGTQYTVTITTRAADGTTVSAAATHTFTAKPAAVTQSTISTTVTSATSVTLTWGAVTTGTFTNYVITVSLTTGGVTVTSPTVAKGTTTTTITGLTAGTQYTVTMKTKSTDGMESDAVTYQFTIQKPAAVSASSISTSNVAANSATLTWGAVTTGTFKEYVITISPTTGGATVTSPTVAKGATTTTTLTSLTASTSYIVTVKTKTDKGVESDPATHTFKTNPAPVTPNTVSVTAITTSAATLLWGPVTGTFQTYEISISPTTGGAKADPASVTKGTTTTTALKDLTPGTTYTVTVKTKDGTQLSAGADKTFRTKPAAVSVGTISFPTNTITTNSAKASWTKVAGVVSSYTVAISPTSPGSPTVNPSSVTTLNAPATDLTGLVPGVEYTLSITTVSNGVSSSVVTKKFRTKPPTPGSITVDSVEMTSAKGKWTKPTAGSYGTFTNYRITVTPKESGVATPTVTPATVLSSEAAPSVNMTGLVAGEVYTVSVVATWDGVEGTASTKEFRTKPKQVTGIQIDNLATTTATVKWTALTLPSKYTSIYKYDVDIVQTGPSVSPSLVAHPGTSTGITGMTPGTTYKVKVTTVAGTGLLVMNSDPAEHEFTAKPAPVSGSITFTSVTTKTADATWTRVSLGVGTAYKLAISPTGPTMTPNPVPWATDPPKTSLTNLIPGTLYTLTVTPMSGTTEGDPTTGTVRAKPTPVDAGKVTISSITTNSASISWPAITEGVLTSFTVTLDEAGTVTPSSVTNLANPSVQLTGLMAGTKYIATIVTNSAEGKSGPVTKEFYTKPDQASNIKVLSFDTTTAVITWDKTGTGGVDSYDISASPSGATIAPTNVLASATLETNLSNMKPGVQYTVTITAKKGTQTNPVTEQFRTKPLPVTGVTLTPNSDKMTISWKAGVGSTQNQYKVRSRAVFANPTSTWVDATVTHPTLTKEISITPGEKYEVEVMASSGGVDSDKATGSLVTAPFPPSNPSVDDNAATTTSIKVKWKAPTPTSYFIKYYIEYTKVGTTTTKTNEAGASDLEKTIPNLEAGVKYNVKIYTESNDTKKSATSADTDGTAKPNCDVKLTDLTTKTNKLKANYTASTLVFTHYKFVIKSGPGPAIPPIAKATTPRELTYTSGVNPGTKYTITATCVSNGVESAPISADVSAVPSPITKVDPIVPWPNKVVMTVHKPTLGQVGQLLVSCSGKSSGQLNGCTNPQSSSDFLNGDTANITYDKLDSHEFYDFTFKVVTNGKESAEYTQRVRTTQGRPGPASRFLATSLTATTLRLDWSTPVDPNGLVSKYVVSYTGNYRKDTTLNLPTDKQTHIFNVDPNAGTYSRTLTGLRGGYFYDFTLYGQTDYPDPGENVPTSETMKTEAPTLRSGVTAPQKTDISNETIITVEFTKAFNDSNGPVLYYSVIVAENMDNDKLSEASNADDLIRRWHQVKEITENWPPYMAISQCNIFDTSLNCDQSPGVSRRRLLAVSGNTVQIKIGIQDCEKVSSTGFCNGPLKPGTHYQVRLRGYTGPGQYQDTVYSERIPTTPRDNTAIIVGVVVALLIILFVAAGVAIYFFIKYKKAEKARKYQETSAPPPQSAPDRSRPVRLQDFPGHHGFMHADTDFRFAEEYDDLKDIGTHQSYSESELGYNRGKNRFTNILPYDRSRVKLSPQEDVEGSDYINSNYIPGYTSKREYVACQGPLVSTKDDFWRMIWEQNCQAIVMLTRCVENGREKCSHYWPEDTDPVIYGDIEVVILNETQNQDYNITQLRMTKGGEERRICHFHFLVWPDFSAPDVSGPLLRFLYTFRERVGFDSSRPICVHCSAGVGRSGTFITLDRLTQHMKQHDYVDIYGTVYEMRMHRRYMVQTEQQYIFIHRAILDIINDKVKKSPPSPDDGRENPAFEDDEGITLEVLS